MSKKIIGVTVGSSLPKPNFKQTDPTKGDYIKNKPDFEGLEDRVDVISGLVGDTKVSEQINKAIAEIPDKIYTQNEEPIDAAEGSLWVDLDEGEASSGGSAINIVVDSELSSTSENPVQNKVVNAAINNLNNLVGKTPVSEQISNAIAQVPEGSGVAPDWNQNDHTASDYIKNRPFYSGELVETELADINAILLENDLSWEKQGEETVDGTNYLWTTGVSSYFLTLEDGKEYSVEISGNKYTSVATLENFQGNEIICIGDFEAYISLIEGGQANDFTYAIGHIPNQGVEIMYKGIESPTECKIYNLEQEIVKIDTKYLPEGGVGYTTGGEYGILVEEKTMEFTADDNWYALISNSLIFTEGETYFVTFNGELYECVAWRESEDEYPVNIGNRDIYSGEGEPFCFVSWEDNACYLRVAGAGTYTIKIEGNARTVHHKIDPKYIPERIKSNWIENNSNKESYIANRPFYAVYEPSEELLAEQTIETTEDNWEIKLSESLNFVGGETYFITFNGKVYECIAEEDDEGYAFIGNGWFVGLEDYHSGNGEPFFCASWDEGCYITTAPGTHTIKIQSAVLLYVKKIDKKFLPDDTDDVTPDDSVAPDWNQNDENAADYVKNRTHYTIEEGFEIVWDGDTTTAGDPVNANTVMGPTIYYHVSDDTPSDDLLKQSLAKLTTIENGATQTTEVPLSQLWNMAIVTTDATFALYIVVVRKENAQILEATFPRVGTYYMYAEQESMIGYVSALTKQDVVQKLDHKYLPDSIIGHPGSAEYAEVFNDYEANVAQGKYSHAEGGGTRASGEYSHAEGSSNHASGRCSHTEGLVTSASGDCAHAEGTNTFANGNYSHAEGGNVHANGEYSHAEGKETNAVGAYSHVEGYCSYAGGEGSHVEGRQSTALGFGSHAEGTGTLAYASGSHAEGCAWLMDGFRLHPTEDSATTGVYPYSDIFVLNLREPYDQYFVTFGSLCSPVQSVDIDNHIISLSRPFTDISSDTIDVKLWHGAAYGSHSHAEGNHTTAFGKYAHSEGDEAIANEWGSHAEGYRTYACARFSHAEGSNTCTYGYDSYGAHAEGSYTIACGNAQHVQGRYNIKDTERSYAHIVGNGYTNPNVAGEAIRSNAHTLDWDGNAWYQGDIYVGSTSGINKDEGSKKLATEEYVDAPKDYVIINSSTEGSTKKFKLTIGDDGQLNVTEFVAS